LHFSLHPKKVIMNNKPQNTKSCGPQLLPSGYPNTDWNSKQLQNFSRQQNQEILGQEQSLAIVYWRLGTALNLLREDYRHGQWTQELESLGIDKTRASKARAIANTFASEDELANLTVDEAYGKRQRQQRSPERATDQETTTVFCRQLHQVAKTARRFLQAQENGRDPGTVQEVEALLEIINHLEKLMGN
jgi:hypothetical protein